MQVFLKLGLTFFCHLTISFPCHLFIWKKERGRETIMCCSTYLCAHWLLFPCALISNRTYNLGVLAQCCNQPSHLAGLHVISYSPLSLKLLAPDIPSPFMLSRLTHYHPRPSFASPEDLRASALFSSCICAFFPLWQIPQLPLALAKGWERILWLT